jgi:hypothetical protein
LENVLGNRCYDEIDASNPPSDTGGDNDNNGNGNDNDNDNDNPDDRRLIRPGCDEPNARGQCYEETPEDGEHEDEDDNEEDNEEDKTWVPKMSKG